MKTKKKKNLILNFFPFYFPDCNTFFHMTAIFDVKFQTLLPRGVEGKNLRQFSFPIFGSERIWMVRLLEGVVSIGREYSILGKEGESNFCWSRPIFHRHTQGYIVVRDSPAFVRPTPKLYFFSFVKAESKISVWFRSNLRFNTSL